MAILAIQHSRHSGAGHLGAALRTFGQRVRTVRVDEGQPLPADLDDVHGLVSLGGPQSANDGDRWVGQELALIREAHERKIPFLGLCLGAQMLAKALGGEVARMASPEFGWTRVRAASIGVEDALLAGTGWDHVVFESHGEHVATLPPGATVIMKGKACPVQAYRIGPWSYGFQYHPEWTREDILAEIDRSSDADLAAAGTSKAAQRQATAEHAANAERASARIFELANLLLFPASRQQPGLVAPGTVHH
jgi:GMP synthase (glutamine-hydrolysing)